MKVLLINGSPKKDGCTRQALSIIEQTLNKDAIQTEIFNIGNKPIRGCIACKHCHKTGSNKCVFNDDATNELIDKISQADGVIIGTPVYFAGPNASLTAMLDRAFYAASSLFAFKPAASIASARRAGTTPTLDRLNKYFLFANMPVVPSMYWNEIHGNTPQEVLQDKEGVQIMRVLANNMAWLLKSIKTGKDNGVKTPDLELREFTNFIR